MNQWQKLKTKKVYIDKRFVVDIGWTKEMIEHKEIFLTRILGKEQLTDEMTKRGVSMDVFISALQMFISKYK